MNEPGYVFGSLGYSLNLFNLERNIVYGDINRTTTSSTTGNQFNAYGESGYDFEWQKLVVTPTVSVAYSHLWLGSFTESGADSLDLEVGSQSAESLQTGLGGKVSMPLQRDSVLVVPQVYAIWQHEFSDDSRGLDARLRQGSSTFAWLTNQPNRDFAMVGADVTLSKKNFAVQLDYNAEVGRGNYTAHSVSAGLRWRF
jgi:outer membrane autotransporter protein